MENKEELFDAGGDFGFPKPNQENIIPELRRELDSVDDFEHLGHDINQKENHPLEVKSGIENPDVKTDEKNNDLLLSGVDFPQQSDLPKIINKGEVNVDEGAVVSGFIDKTDNNKLKQENYSDNMNDSNLIGDFSPSYDAKEKLDIFLQEKNPSTTIKNVTYDFMEAEKGTKESISSKFEDFEDSPKHLHQDPKKKETLLFSSVENLLDDFRDVKDENEHEKIKEKEPSPLPEKKPIVDAPPVDQKNQEVEKPIKEGKKEELKPAKKTKKEDANVIEAEVLFSKMGLDTWFTPEKLNPRVESLIYWRDPKKSGPVFGGVLVVLLALTYFSLISVIAYLSLIGLTGTISFRVYKNVVQAVQKTGEGHPFKEFLEWDLALPPEKVKEISEVVVAHVNAGLSALRRLFLVEDLIDSIKFGVFMWTLTYLGAWFNGMTLVILAWVALFTLPKVYETNKTQIDANLEIVKSKLAEVTSKVKAAIPLGKKEEKKE